MKMRLAIILLALFSVSCTSSLPSIKPYRMDVQQGNVVNSKMMAQLRPGMTKSQVRFILGTPLIQDSFHKDRWDYFYQLRKSGAVVEQRRVILDFENDLLKGVRGDVIPAGSADASVAPVPDPVPAVEPKAEEKKGLADKLKFWESSENKASQPAAKAVSPDKELTVPADLLPATAATSTAALAIPARADDKNAEDTATEPTKPAVAQTPSETLIASVADAPVASENATADDVSSVKASIAAWADAWRSKDVPRYLQAYSDKFTPEKGISKKAWMAQRKQRLEKPGAVSLTLDDVQVVVNGNNATAEFSQNYTSGSLNDRMRKQLQLERVGDNWLIVRETTAARSNPNRPANVVVVPMTADESPPIEARTVDEIKPDAAEAITARLNEWAQAWRNKDINAYLSVYADKFVPESVSRKSWVAQRRERLAKSGSISLQLDDIKINAQGNKAKVDFIQRYSSGGFSDNVSKSLQMELLNGNWLIVKESAITQAKPSTRAIVADPSSESSTPGLTPEQKSEFMPPPAESPVEPKATPASSSGEPSSEQAAAMPLQESAKPNKAGEKTAQEKTAESKPSEESKASPAEQQEKPPSLFERMLEKIGF